MKITSISEKGGSYGVALLRLIVGVVFIMHGGQKLCVHGLAGTSEGFAGAGVPLASLTAPLVTFVELLGGLALVLGVLTPIVAALLAVVMLGATLMVHLQAGFFLPNGYEFSLTLLAAAVAIALSGPGAFAVDNLLARRHTTA